MTTPAASRVVRSVAIALVLLGLAHDVHAQLNENCIVSVLNRTVKVNADGSWVLPNVPANFGLVRARATCIVDGKTISGESDLFPVPQNGLVNKKTIFFGASTPIPTSLTVTAPAQTLTVPGATLQVEVFAHFADGTVKDVSLAAAGTQYTISNPAIATVSADGLVAVASGGVSGTVLVQATNEGASGLMSVLVALGASHGSIPDSWALAYGLNPSDPVMPFEDPDRDNLTNLEEFQAGTNPIVADTDGDGLSDGDEVKTYRTQPLLADTDGDRIPDGIEVRTGTNPLDRNSYDLRAATAVSTVRPATFVMTTSALFPSASQLLNWKVTLIDGTTTLDLTSDSRTNYSSSNLSICNFGGERGRVFAGSPGSCVITLTNNTLSAEAVATVKSFTPTALSFVNIPGFANNVDVAGNYAYVAAGSAGLQIVDVSNPSSPNVVASRALPGNANDVVVAGSFAYVAAGSAGLQIVDIQNPLAPTLTGSLGTGDVAWDVAVKGSRAYVANGAKGLSIIDVSTPASPTAVGSLALPGTTKGVDVDSVRQLAVVARGTSGVSVIDVSDPASPALLATLGGGDVRDVAISGNFAFLADFSRSFTAVDISNPSAPVLRPSTPSSTGGLLQDVAVNGTVAAGADVFFVNGVPLIDVSSPASPQPRFILDFRSFRDDNGTGIAMDSRFVYLTAESGSISENGVTGSTRLYIGQYRSVLDDAGIAPTVRITSPAGGTQVIEGSTVMVTADASDDVAVAQVNFSVNGLFAFASGAPPYQYSFTAPAAGSPVRLGATAIDFGGNTATATDVTLSVIPDPLTTVVGRVLDAGGIPVVGANVSTLSRSATTGADGTFSIDGVVTVRGNVTVVASATIGGTVLGGRSGSFAPVPGGATNVGDIVVRQSETIFLLGTDAVSFHHDGAFASQLWAHLGSNVAYVNNFGVLGATTVNGQPVTGFASIPASLTPFSALFIASPFTCCDDPARNPSLGVASNAAAISAFVSAGGILVIEDFQGAADWDSVLGFSSAAGVTFGAPFANCSDPGVSTAAGIAAGFTGSSAPNTYLDFCFGHQAYNDSFFAAHGFTSLIDAAGLPAGSGVVLVKGLTR